jgi:hypothetical protein
MIAVKYKLQGIICTISLSFQPSQAYVTFRQSKAEEQGFGHIQLLPSSYQSAMISSLVKKKCNNAYFLDLPHFFSHLALLFFSMF